MKVLEKTRLALIADLEKKLKNPRTTPWQAFNIREQVRLYKRMIEIDKLQEKRLKPQLLKKGKK
jgi:hypothetical protein